MYTAGEYRLIKGRREVVQQIYPVCNETVFPLMGKRVCAVTNDGTHYYGTVSEVRDGRVFLTECTVENGTLELAAAKTEGKMKKPYPKKKAKLSGLYGGYGNGYGFNSFWLDFALISLLFFLPFFFI
jgi:hypothetical protein